MTLPQAAQATSPVPGLWLRVDLQPGNVAPGAQGLRAILIAPENSTGGSITPETEIKPVYSQADVEGYTGDGSLHALAYAALLAKDKYAQVDIIACAESGGSAATNSVTVSGTLTEDGSIEIVGHGVPIDVPIYAGEALTVWRSRAVDYITRLSKKLHFTAAAGAGDGQVDLTSKSAGLQGNDIALRARVKDATGASVAVTAAKFTGGTTEVDYTNALSAIEGREYDYIGLCLSNTDAEDTTGGVADALTHINGLNTGLGARLQQLVVGHTGTRAAGQTQTAAMNDQVANIITAANAEALPCQIMGDEIGDRMYWRRQKHSANRIGRFVDVPGSHTPISDNPTEPEAAAALNNGLSVVGYTDSGKPVLVRSVTTYHETAQGSSVLVTDVNEIDGLYDYAKDLRAFLPVQFSGVKVTEPTGDDDTPDDDLPEDVVTTDDIRAAIVARTESYWIPKGVINGGEFAAAAADDGELAVEINATDETQVDIFIPAKPFKNLAKLGVYIRKAG